MLMMSVENGFFIQDLISERGVWVRKKGDDTYHREDNSVQLSHGDWLRLGDLEFVVSLVAYVGVK
jgi:predicted component of type VI protein secretion system